MFENSLVRAQQLIEHRRFPEAERAIRIVIAEAPELSKAHILLFICLYNQERNSEALDTIKKAISLSPENPDCYYYKGLLLFRLKKTKEAEQDLRQAILLDPDNPNYYGLLSVLLLDLEKREEALHVAEQGLHIDPEDVQCNNIRARVLTLLGRHEESRLTLDFTLESNPEDSFTHTNKGWSLLHQGDYKNSLTHFSEALRIDPTNDLARAGIVESLKSKNILYRPILAYLLWMQRLSRKNRWYFILGLFFLMRLLREIGTHNESLTPYFIGISILYVAFVYLSWTAQPLFNLLLRFNKFGRNCLNKEQVQTSNIIGSLLMGGAISAGLAFWLQEFSLLLLAGIAIIMVIPVSALSYLRKGNARSIMAIYTVIVALAGIAAVYVSPGSDIQNAMVGIFSLGLFASQFIFNILYSKQ